MPSVREFYIAKLTPKQREVFDWIYDVTCALHAGTIILGAATAAATANPNATFWEIMALTKANLPDDIFKENRKNRMKRWLMILLLQAIIGAGLAFLAYKFTQSITVAFASLAAYWLGYWRADVYNRRKKGL